MSAKENGDEPIVLSNRTLCPDRRIEYLQRAIESDPSRGIPELARMVNLSPSRLSHLFKHCTHKTLRAYLTQRRLEMAAQLLVGSESSVKEISYSVGYSRPASFIRAFQKSFGCSPKDYRVSCVARRLGCCNR
jgi:AraC-like DNA-binding protein